MKQQFFITHRYTILQQTEKTWPILNMPAFKHVTFRKHQDKQFYCGHDIMTEGVFVTQLPSDPGICLTNCVSYDKLMFHWRYTAV